MTERINLTMKKWTKCNENNTHWEKKQLGWETEALDYMDLDKFFWQRILFRN